MCAVSCLIIDAQRCSLLKHQVVEMRNGSKRCKDSCYAPAEAGCASSWLSLCLQSFGSESWRAVDAGLHKRRADSYIVRCHFTHISRHGRSVAHDAKTASITQRKTRISTAQRCEVSGPAGASTGDVRRLARAATTKVQHQLPLTYRPGARASATHYSS